MANVQTALLDSSLPNWIMDHSTVLKSADLLAPLALGLLATHARPVSYYPTTDVPLTYHAILIASSAQLVLSNKMELAWAVPQTVQLVLMVHVSNAKKDSIWMVLAALNAHLGAEPATMATPAKTALLASWKRFFQWVLMESLMPLSVTIVSPVAPIVPHALLNLPDVPLAQMVSDCSAIVATICTQSKQPWSSTSTTQHS